MKNKEYIIINRTALEKRIEELETLEAKLMNEEMSYTATRAKIDELYYILHISTPLIPEIEKSWEHGYTRGYNLACCEGVNSECLTPDKQNYISNLELNI